MTRNTHSWIQFKSVGLASVLLSCTKTGCFRSPSPLSLKNWSALKYLLDEMWRNLWISSQELVFHDPFWSISQHNIVTCWVTWSPEQERCYQILPLTSRFSENEEACPDMTLGRGKDFRQSVIRPQRGTCCFTDEKTTHSFHETPGKRWGGGWRKKKIWVKEG